MPIGNLALLPWLTAALAKIVTLFGWVGGLMQLWWVRLFAIITPLVFFLKFIMDKIRDGIGAAFLAMDQVSIGGNDIPDGDMAGMMSADVTLMDYLELVNYILPLNALIIIIPAMLVLVAACFTYRFVKSWIPTMG